MRELLRYYYKMYVKSNRWIAPLIIWVIYLYISNTTRPAQFVPNVTASGGILYFIMIWMSFSYMDFEDNTSEQLLILKLRNVHKFNFSKALFISLVGICMSLLGVAVPVIQHIANGFTLFTRQITPLDIIYGIILLCCMSFLGAMTGCISHPRLIKNRKESMFLLFAIALFGYIKGPVIEDFSFAKYILWICPPAYDILIKYANLQYFNLHLIGYSIILAVGYGLIMFLIYMYGLKKNRF